MWHLEQASEERSRSGWVDRGAFQEPDEDEWDTRPEGCVEKQGQVRDGRQMGDRERKVGERLEGIWWWQLLNIQNRISA